MTGDSQPIDQVLEQIHAMVQSVESFPVDVFDKRYETSWETVMTKFKESVKQIESMAKQFIDKSFNNLRSAEGAFDLLQNFENVKSREAINEQMMDKYKDVLQRYRIELNKTKDLFVTMQASPPYSKNQPPRAGSIHWCRLLFHKIKKPVVKFQTLPDLLQSDRGVEVKNEYLSVGRQIRDYEVYAFKQWCDTVEPIALMHLKSFILKEVPSSGPSLAGSSSSEPNTVIQVQFNPELRTIIRETKYLDQLVIGQNQRIPETALSVALQEVCLRICHHTNHCIICI